MQETRIPRAGDRNCGKPVRGRSGPCRIHPDAIGRHGGVAKKIFELAARSPPPCFSGVKKIDWCCLLFFLILFYLFLLLVFLFANLSIGFFFHLFYCYFHFFYYFLFVSSFFLYLLCFFLFSSFFLSFLAVDFESYSMFFF